jgi:exopolysaccharide biosynthesis polyprenyl glycosylphosphotransferase
MDKSAMRKKRLCGTIAYALCCSLAFVLSGYTWMRSGLISHFNLYIISLLFISGIADTFLLEGSLDIYRLSRMKVLGNWLVRSFSVFFIGFVSYNLIIQRLFDFKSFIDQWLILFSIAGLIKIIFLSFSSHQLKFRRVHYDTILVGSGLKANTILEELKNKLPSQGQNFLGSVGSASISDLKCLGNTDNLETILTQYNIDEVILALEQNQNDILIHILNRLRSVRRELMIRITPDSYDFLMGRIKMDAVYGAALIELPKGKMKLWQSVLKRTLDILSAVLLILVLSPLLIYICIKTWISSPGPILYSQQRIGQYGKTFKIYKFRSMYVDAESFGPQLSFEGDTRCTPWGFTMRKWRLDELPQFINVILGEMSIVGPRPEREYFIQKIKKIAPYYSRILTVRPGITSWGQVKYGYASDINQMVERLKFDLIYVENQSLSLDIKIILYTILVLFQGKGK